MVVRGRSTALQGKLVVALGRDPPATNIIGIQKASNGSERSALARAL